MEQEDWDEYPDNPTDEELEILEDEKIKYDDSYDRVAEENVRACNK